MSSIGIYIHVPFCKRKCAYCDFFSVCSLKAADGFTSAVLKDMERFRKKGIKADSLYLGGGTPTELGKQRLCRIIERARDIFDIDRSAEITVETNPQTAEGDTPKSRESCAAEDGKGRTAGSGNTCTVKDLQNSLSVAGLCKAPAGSDDIRRGNIAGSTKETEKLFESLYAVGVNRLSIGMQSSNDRELEFLGRRHKAQQVKASVMAAKAAGIENISLDIMLGIPFQTEQSLEKTIGFADSLPVSHISAYILKIEQNTAFYRLFKQGKLNVCDDDLTAKLYLSAARQLEERGFMQYEISNFAKKGFEGRHNLKYWHDEQYLGFGPSAHSFFEGKRFYYPRSLKDYEAGVCPIFDSEGGDAEEYLMLGLRLSEGISFERFERRYGYPVPEKTVKTAKELEKHGLMTVTDKCFSLTRQGFLLSNEIISRLI